MQNFHILFAKMFYFIGILLAKCWLTGSLCLNDKYYADKRVQYYKKLILLDPLRKGEYEDYLKAVEDKASGDK